MEKRFGELFEERRLTRLEFDVLDLMKGEKSSEQAQEMKRLERQLQDQLHELERLDSEIEKAEVFSEVLS